MIPTVTKLQPILAKRVANGKTEYQTFSQKTWDLIPPRTENNQNVPKCGWVKVDPAAEGAKTPPEAAGKAPPKTGKK